MNPPSRVIRQLIKSIIIILKFYCSTCIDPHLFETYHWWPFHIQMTTDWCPDTKRNKVTLWVVNNVIPSYIAQTWHLSLVVGLTRLHYVTLSIRTAKMHIITWNLKLFLLWLYLHEDTFSDLGFLAVLHFWLCSTLQT